jgi:pilus assembly protein Flp/PilA
MKDRFIAYLKDETGQTSTEYILLVAVVATIVLKFKSAITRKLFGQSEDGNGGILGTVLDESKFANFGVNQ